jgi:hypothetical protein
MVTLDHPCGLRYKQVGERGFEPPTSRTRTLITIRPVGNHTDGVYQLTVRLPVLPSVSINLLKLPTLFPYDNAAPPYDNC